MAVPRSHTSLAALLTLPAELRDCVAESMRRDAMAQAKSPSEAPCNPSRISMTAHLREVLVERGVMHDWRRHFEDSRSQFAPRRAPERVEERRDELAPIFGEFIAAPA